MSRRNTPFRRSALKRDRLQFESLERRDMMSADLMPSTMSPYAMTASALPGASYGAASCLTPTTASNSQVNQSVDCRDLTSAAPMAAMMSSHPLMASALPGASYLAAPNLTATAVSSSQINLAWNSVAGANGYLVDIWVNGAWKQIGNFGSGATGCAVTGLSANTTYYFDVGAYNSSTVAWANYTSAVTRVVAPAAPSLTATVASSSQVNLAWNNVAGATGYLIDEWVNGAWQQIGNFGSGTTSCAVTGLSANSTYYFTIGAYNSAGTTWASNYVTVTTSSGGGATIDHPTAATTYTVVNGTLFGANGPVYTDVQQGGVGDCWLMASLAEVAARAPNDIRNMFSYLGTTVESGVTVGLYSVRFFDSNHTARYVTVDTELPSGGTYYDHVNGGVLWVALAEKAYAQANGKGYVTTQHTYSDAYSALDGGQPFWALQAITGQSASSFAINPTNLAAAWSSGKLIVLGTSPNAQDNLIVGDSQGTHAYAVIGYNGSSSNPFELFNPWNTTSVVGGLYNWNGHQVYGGAFWFSATLISKDFASQSIGAGTVAEGDAMGGGQHNADSTATGRLAIIDQAMAVLTYSAPKREAPDGSVASDAVHGVAALGKSLDCHDEFLHLTDKKVGVSTSAADYLFADLTDVLGQYYRHRLN